MGQKWPKNRHFFDIPEFPKNGPKNLSENTHTKKSSFFWLKKKFGIFYGRNSDLLAQKKQFTGPKKQFTGPLTRFTGPPKKFFLFATNGFFPTIWRLFLFTRDFPALAKPI